MIEISNDLLRLIIMGKTLRKYLIPFPFLFCIYPLLTLIAFNISEMPLEDGFRALIISLILTLTIFTLLAILIKNPIKSSILTTLILVLIFSYGHTYDILYGITVMGNTLGRHRYLGFVYLVFLVIASWFILNSRHRMSTLPIFLNFITLSLLIIPLYQIMHYQLERSQAYREIEKDVYIESGVSRSQDQPAPDVYYIITDGYPRNDFIFQYMDMDNSYFLDYLDAKRFFVAECSQSNYTTTSGSMAGTLNMNYLLNNDGERSGALPPDPKLDAMIHSNEVQAIFSNLDYTIVTFDNGYPWLNWETSDVRFDLPFELSDLDFFTETINDFEILAIKTTALRLFLDLSILPELEQYNIPITDWDIPGVHRRNKIFFMLDTLPEIPKTIPSPKFVYFHIVFPHPPYIVDADGELLNEEPADELAAYADQITFINSRLINIIDTLLEESDPEPIIVIQSDHGASIDYEGLEIDKANRLGILNAFHLPGIDINELYSTISPVNTFRLIFDRYFNGQYGLLPDNSIVGKEGPFTTISCSLDPKQ